MGHLEGNFTPVLYMDAWFLKVNFPCPVTIDVNSGVTGTFCRSLVSKSRIFDT